MTTFDRLQISSRKLLQDFDYKTAQKAFGLDKSNFYAYRAGSKPIPFHIICSVIDYTGAKLVVFNPI